uniref:Uncharacterized protein n=1 Tax=Tetraselmis sp. GSL018 TaxID=582737 RepID=A0A061S1Y1_9CHLO|mmetsp:Transcript_6957/g.16745  ORF Transcript_6957/g.16745 Transcript_6957/m.16745 type:complete len:381 (-) Transcript_6957:130-1272(-)|eukprot:CAMPEP_0177603698 /NCGR_PEP_ID=MMETSP0419_2-20121207/15668_1 /TAXON_ID=582737 /ORGANISM="Tetraselmis sp., Strain GSL018" /LENGTH=380 /DNA_ID=CAMNT_0019097521 /DNA_START=289 /DNA_END=1431 /DNA_ORIENTATION=-
MATKSERPDTPEHSSFLDQLPPGAMQNPFPLENMGENPLATLQAPPDSDGCGGTNGLKRKTPQEKRTCPECGTQVGPRFGTGKDGEGSQCPGSLADGTRCSYTFTAGRRKLQHQELIAQCSSKQSGPLSLVKAGFEKAARKVVTEAAKTGGTAILLWYNVVDETADNNRDLNRIIQKTAKLDSQQPPAREGDFAYTATASSSHNVSKSCVVMQATTGTEAAEVILKQVAPAVHLTAVQYLQKAADRAAIERTMAPPPAPPPPAASAAERAQPMASVMPASQEPPPLQPEMLHELEAFLRSIGQHEACFHTLARNGLSVGVMRAIIQANKGELPGFVEALKHAGLSAGHAMVLFAHLNKMPPPVIEASPLPVVVSLAQEGL